MIDDQAMAMPGTWAIWEFDMAAGYPHTIGWIGAGRMGSALIKRLLANGCDVSVYNRTKAKAEALVEFGAKVVDGDEQHVGARHLDRRFRLGARLQTRESQERKER